MEMNTVITGGTKGIGLAIAHEFAAKGSNLIICARNEADLVAFETQFKKQYPDLDIWVQKADLAKKKEVLDFADFVKSKMSEINVLVNNAGLYLTGDLLEEAEGSLESQIDTNLYAAYHLCRALVPMMVEQKRGHIFNICSIACLRVIPSLGSYSISKHALLGFTKALREELKNKEVKVTAVLPGATWSSSWDGVELPEERLLQAEDVAKSIGNAFELSRTAVVEEIVLRPQEGDL